MTRLGRAIVLITYGLLLSGCQQKKADGIETIRFSSYASSPAETGLMEALVAEFNRAHPSLRVRYEPVPGQYYPKMLTMLVSHTAPDVFYLDVAYFEPFLSKRVLRPLNDFLARSSLRSGEFVPALWRAFRDGSTVYGIPKDFNTYALFYNRAMFQAAHLNPPDATWTLERFREAARQLTQAGRTPRYGFGLTLDADRYLPIARSFGAPLFASNGQCDLASPAGVEAMAFYADLKLRDHAAIYPSEIGSSWTGDAFGRQSVAMAIEGGWLVPYLRETFPEVPFGVAELPRGPRGRSNFLFTVAYVIPASSRHAEAAWQLIEFLTSEAAQRRVTFALPSRKSASSRYVAAHPDYRPFLKGAEYAMPYAFGPMGDRVKDRIGSAVQEVLLGGKDPERALREACDDIDQLTKL